MKEIQVAEQSTIPPVLVEMQNGTIFMADQTDGLRAWAAKGDQRMLAQILFENSVPPTSLAVDMQKASGSTTRVMVGFENGGFALYSLRTTSFIRLYEHEPSSSGVISATSLVYPYAVTMSATQCLSLYKFKELPTDQKGEKMLNAPRLLHSLKSSNIWPPISTSLRPTESSIAISIAYAVPTYLSGWTVGIQEIWLDHAGTLLKSRLASAIDQHYRPLGFSSQPIINHLPAQTIGSLATSTTAELRHIHIKPTSLSYTHPYLLVSHPDNTLTLYLVTSTTDSLSISPGSRLWGHTSSVSGAHIGGRGKAVSVSRRGDELRVWELEGGFASSAARRRLVSGDLSVKIRPEKRAVTETPQAGLDLVNNASSDRARDDEATELTLTRGWIGFDEENVVVLKEQSQGRQALVVYDFT